MFAAIKKWLNFREPLRYGLSDNEDVEPTRLLDHRALAHELNRYDRDRFHLARYDVNIEQKFQVDAFKAAVRATPGEEYLANFTFPLAPGDLDTEEATLVPTYAEGSDLTTLGEPDLTLSIIETMKPVDLFSLEDIFSDESEIIPPLLIRYTDIVGSEHLVYKRDAAIYYDFCVDQIERHVSSRGVMAIPRAPDHEFFCDHAVRVFLQVPDIPDIVDGPFYRYMGDCYIVKTDQLLSQHEWNVLPEYLKERFVKRFVELHNSLPKDGFRAQNRYTSATARELLDHGNTYPLIVLMQAQHQEETLECYSPIQLNGTELLFLPPDSPKSVDSASVYSQESAPRDHEEFAFPFYSSATGPDNPLSPLFTDPFDGNVIITFPSGEQEVYPPSRAAFAHNAEDYGIDENRLNDWHNNKDRDAGNNYDEDSDDNGGNEGEGDCKVQHNGYQGTTCGIEKRSCWFDNEQTDEDGATEIQHPANEISESDRARYAALKVFCEELEETSRADTAMGRVQLQFIDRMRAEMAALGLWDDTNPENGDGGIDHMF
ncbi:hypothetical protein C0989_005999 [Termitomyces sp. Mn162]|nr:hypothetical protein C0989_005999 [Termitomyces sp. Mn162]